MNGCNKDLVYALNCFELCGKIRGTNTNILKQPQDCVNQINEEEADGGKSRESDISSEDNGNNQTQTTKMTIKTI